MSTSKQKVGVLLLAMGGPSSLDEIPRYLYNIFSDRTLIRLPGGALFQKPFATLISRLRSKKVAAHYAEIGGSSPLLKWTESQASHIKKFLAEQNHDVTCYTGMRYSEPSIRKAVEQMIDDGVRQVIVLPMYPQFSTATTGSSVKELVRMLKGRDDVKWELIKDFHNYDPYIELFRKYIAEHTKPEDVLLYSAHSLPQRFVDEGDPYVDQIRRTASLTAGDREYYVSFQSKTGPVNWVGPDTIEETKRLLQESNRRICLVPVAFVCDHIETLHELDIELPELVGESERLYRLPMFNDDPNFGRVLADLVAERLPNRVEA